MQNFTNYKSWVLHRNSDAFSILSAANKSNGQQREALLKQLDQHLQQVAQNHKQLLERYG